jgi:hypothetical protein
VLLLLATRGERSEARQPLAPVLGAACPDASVTKVHAQHVNVTNALPQLRKLIFSLPAEE